MKIEPEALTAEFVRLAMSLGDTPITGNGFVEACRIWLAWDSSGRDHNEYNAKRAARRIVDVINTRDTDAHYEQGSGVDWSGISNPDDVRRHFGEVRNGVPFDDARREYVNGIELGGGEIPLPDQTTSEQLAEHVSRVVGSFWDWPGNVYGNVELVYRVSLGALRKMRDQHAEIANLTRGILGASKSETLQQAAERVEVNCSARARERDAALQRVEALEAGLREACAIIARCTPPFAMLDDWNAIIARLRKLAGQR